MKGKSPFQGSRPRKLTNRKVLAKKVGMIRQQFDLVGQLPVIHNVLAGRLADWGFFKSLWSLIIPQEKQAARGALEKSRPF